MARLAYADIWPALTLEGNLIAPAMMARIGAGEATEQASESYGVRQGLGIREEIALAFRVGQSHWTAFQALEAPSLAATRRFVRGFLRETFGFDDLEESEDGALTAGGRVPVVVAAAGASLDRRDPVLGTAPILALRDRLGGEGALWGLTTNGRVLRLSRDDASLTRPAQIEADLEKIFQNSDIASFSTLWLLVHRSRFGHSPALVADCPLERWREAGGREGEAARDRLAGQVEEALAVLGSGLLRANPGIEVGVAGGEIALPDLFEELLRFVYRLIFLMVAEDRDLLHPPDADPVARNLYEQGYSLSMLRERAARRASRDGHADRYEGLKIVFRALERGEPRLGLHALGGLFARGGTPVLDAASLPNDALMAAVWKLSWLPGRHGMTRIDWRTMKTEELGSVYESLLELQPRLSDDGRGFGFATAAAETKGNKRKTTGSYYTPDALVEALLDDALDPVLDRAEGQGEAALLALDVIDPACGSGHFLLAAAARIATHLARLRVDGAPSMADYRHALRDVARDCLHGVDRNPMAVELTKVALWIETVEPGMPLGFLDASIVCGDALLGVSDLASLEAGIPDAAFKPLAGDDKAVAKYYAAKNRREHKDRARIEAGFNFAGGRSYVAEFSEMRAMPEGDVGQIAAKAARRRKLLDSGSGWRLARACDMRVAAFLMPKTGEIPGRGRETIPTSGALWDYLREMQPYGPMLGAATEAASEARALHWPLAFPDVMAKGGFDAVLGNPPWDVVQLSEQEYFTTRDPEIAQLKGAARKKAIVALETEQPEIFAAYTDEKRDFDARNVYARESGRFALTARGKINTYALFAELFLSLTGPKGRAGVIVPTGIATDATTAPFFAHLVAERRLARLISFENEEMIFPAVHHAFKFALMVIGPKGGQETRFTFFLRQVEQMHEPKRSFTLSPEQIARLNPNTRTAPVFRSHADAELTAKIYDSAPILISEGSEPKNEWKIGFHTRLWNMGDDAAWFREPNLADVSRNTSTLAISLDNENLMPLYEAKMFHIFDHLWANHSDQNANDGRAEIASRYWVPEEEVERRLDSISWKEEFLLCVREITSATNERTVIGSFLPCTAVGHTATMLLSKMDARYQCMLISNLNSIILDYCARQVLGGTHLTLTILKQLPILPPNFYDPPKLDFIAPRVLELTYTSHSMAPFARDLGHDGPPYPWDEERRAALRADLDAFYARAYGLTRAELRYILDPAAVKGEDYPSETFRVLKNNDTKAHGHYRTETLTLEAWDRMEVDGTFAGLGMDGTAAPPPIVDLPSLQTLRAGAWAWSDHDTRPNRLAYASQYALWLSDGDEDAGWLGLAVALQVEPAKLTPLLDAQAAAQWQRLVGAQARPDPVMEGVTRLRPTIDVAWRDNVTTLRTSGQMRKREDGGWVKGNAFEPPLATADDPMAQRTLFVLRAVRGLTEERLSETMVAEDLAVLQGSGHG